MSHAKKSVFYDGMVNDWMYIRRGWGQHKSRPGISFAFLVGTPDTQQQIKQLIHENLRN